MRGIIHKRELYIPKGAKPVKRKGLPGIVYTYDNTSGYPSAVAFRGNAQKPTWRYWFHSLESRDRSIKTFFDGIKAQEKFKQERKEKNKKGAEEFAKSLAPGQYFRHSWGYDQTNIDFLVIVEVSPTRKTVLCRMADSTNVGTSGTSYAVMPGCAKGNTFRMKVTDGHLVGSYPYCGDSHGYSYRKGYFHKINIGDVSYETMPQFGH